MAADLKAIRGFAHVTDLAETLLTGPEAPIVIVDRNNAAPLADSVAPDTATYGVLLPYTPLHILLLDGLDARALVLTSGNLTDEPLATDNEEAMARLGAIADGFLLHDRAIFIGCDDSVIRPTARGPIIMRRSRGYVPFPVRLREPSPVSLEGPPRAQRAVIPPPRAGSGSTPAHCLQAEERTAGRGGTSGPQEDLTALRAAAPPNGMGRAVITPAPTILALGGHLKNTFCITRGTNAFLSQHIGDLETLETLEYFERSIDHFKMILQVEPEGLACDLHPGFLSTHYAEELARDHALPLERVQHHHAHLAAVLADNRLPGPAVGIICDGTGFGADGTIWGCELLVGDAAACERAGHLRTIRLPGGEAAIREPWRLAAAWLQEAFGPDFADELAIPFTEQLDREAWTTLAEMMERGINAPEASSAGRLFDAVAALIGLYQRVEYEAQAPMKLEALVDPSPPAPLSVPEEGGGTTTAAGWKPAPLPLEGPPRAQRAVIPPPRAGSGSTPAHCLHAEERTAGRGGEVESPLILDPTPILRAIVDGIRQGASQAELAAGFHASFVMMLADGAEEVARARGLDLIALSGGTFQNRIVLESLMDELERRELRAIMHLSTPPGDGCVALGQAAVAQARWK
jgi:hydrogenase maturation protein HypF